MMSNQLEFMSYLRPILQNTHFVVECRSDIDVLYLREIEEIELVLKGLEERWKDPENYFFENNKLLPWI